MINTLSIASDGYLSNNTLSIASNGYLYLQKEYPYIIKQDADGGDSTKATKSIKGSKYDYIAEIKEEDIEILLILKTFVKCQN